MLQVHFLPYLDELDESSLGREFCLPASQCASAFKVRASMLKPECCRKCLRFRPSVCMCVCHAAEYQLPVMQPKPSGCLIVLHSKPPMSSESSLLSKKTIKDTLHACRIITEGGCHKLHSRSSMDEHVHCIMAGVNGAQQGQIETL